MEEPKGQKIPVSDGNDGSDPSLGAMAEQHVINDIVVTPVAQSTEEPVVAEPAATANEFISQPIPATTIQSAAAVHETTASESHEPAGEVMPVTETAVAPPQESPKKKSGPNMVLLSLAVLLLLGALGVGAWFMLGKKDSDKKTTSNSATTPTEQQPVKKEVAIIKQLSQEKPINVFPPNFVSTNANIQVMHQVFESLVAFEEQTTLKPLLAESWTNPDTSTWVFKLKKDVKFHTGRTMTAEDVKTSIETEKATKGYEIYTNTIKSIEVVDDLTVKIVTSKPDAILLNRLTFLFIYDTKSDKKADPVNGTGAYTLKTGTTLADNDVELVAFDDYHGGKPLTRELSFKSVDPDKLAAEANTTSYDIVAGLSESDLQALLKKETGSISFNSPTSSVQNLYFNSLGTGPFSKKEVRKAVLLMVDPQKVIKVANVDAIQVDQIVPKTIPGYSSTYKRPAIDVEAAKKLMKDAGYEKGFTVNLAYGGQLKTTAEEIATELAEIGITVKPLAYTDGTKFFNDSQGGKLDMFISAYSSDINDLSDVVSAVYQKGNLYNIYDNKTVNEQLDKANSEFDPAKRLKLLEEVSNTLLEDVASVPIRVRNYKSFIKNPALQMTFDFPGSAVPNVYFWKVYEKQ